MSILPQRVELSLRSFYIFNSRLGEKEGEEYKKILYYHPNDVELNTKVRDVGLSEAIIAFTGTFTEDDHCKALHTLKTTQLFYQPEPDYWMVLVLNVPKEIRPKDGIEVAEYRGSDIHDRIYRTVLQQSYNMFRLFAGTFGMNCSQATTDHEHLREKLTLFFDKYLLSVKFAACDVMDIMRSIQYLPLDKFLFLRAHNFVSMMHATFPIIAETIFLYNEQVVCSGKLDPIDLYSLHEFIVGTMLRAKTMPAEVGGAALQRSNSNTEDTFRIGTFIAGGSDETADKPPKVFLGKGPGGVPEAYFLIIYRAHNSTMCLFVKGDKEPQGDFYADLHSYMAPQLTTITRDIRETLTKQLQQSSGSGKQTPLSAAAAAVGCCPAVTDATSPKYLFINEQSLKHLTNISFDRRLPRAAQSIPACVMSLIADLGNDEGADNSAAEVQVKTTNDFWIVKRRCNWRQYYIIIFNSKATLLDVTVEAKRIFEQELTDDVFFDI